MKDFLLFRDCDNWGERLLVIFAWLIIASAAIGLFVLADYVGGQAHDAVGTANGRSHSPAYITTTYISNGQGGGHTQVVYHPETWGIFVFAEGEDHHFSVGEYYYNTVRAGEKIECTLVEGCMTGMVYSGHLK